MHDCILFLINRSARLVQCCLLLVLISERDCRAIHLTERSYLCWSGLLLLEIYLPFPVGISLLVSSRVYGTPYLLAVHREDINSLSVCYISLMNGSKPRLEDSMSFPWRAMLQHCEIELEDYLGLERIRV